MDSKTAERLLDCAGLKVTSRTRTKDNFADRLECSSGEIVNVMTAARLLCRARTENDSERYLVSTNRINR